MNTKPGRRSLVAVALSLALAVSAAAAAVHLAGTARTSVSAPTPASNSDPQQLAVVQLVAGGLGGAGTLDGVGPAARFDTPIGIAIDGAGVLYVADYHASLIRKITSDFEVSTWIGFGSISLPNGLAADRAGTVYVANGLYSVIYKITPDGTVSILAGGGVPGSVDGTGEEARFNDPEGVAVDGVGNVYVADTGNSTIRKITPDGTVTTVAGVAGQTGSADGSGGTARLTNPQGIAVDEAGNLFIADTGNDTIRKITPDGTVTTLAGKAGDAGSADGSGSDARFAYPGAIAVDNGGTLFVADSGNSTIRKIVPGNSVTTLAGTAQRYGSKDGIGSEALFNGPAGIVVDSTGILYVTDAGNETVRRIAPDGTVTTVDGKAPQPGRRDGIGSAARFNGPNSIAVTSEGTIYVADTANHTIRKIDTGGAVSTLAGKAGDAGSADGSGSDARFAYPGAIAVDNSGTLYVADSGNSTIRKITPNGMVTTIAGSAGKSGSTDGTGSAARFRSPEGITVDASGTLYVADTENDTIRKITPDGVVTTLAGAARQTGAADGLGSAARFFFPHGIAVDDSGILYVADMINATIRKITPDGVVTTLAGSPESRGSLDGPGRGARFNDPLGVVVDRSGTVYVADSGNDTVRLITPDAVVTTVVGSPGRAGVALGKGGTLNTPAGIGLDASGFVYVTSENSVLKASIAPVIHLSASPTSVTLGSYATLNWTTSHANSCVAGGSWGGPKPLQGSASVRPGPVGTVTYSLTCAGAGGTNSVSIAITVNPIPVVRLSLSTHSIVLGDSAVLSWTTANVTSCTASGAWAGGKPTSGDYTVTPRTAGLKHYDLTCNGPGGNAVATQYLQVSN